MCCQSKIREKITALVLVAPAAIPGGKISNQYLDDFISARRVRDMKKPASLLFHNPDMVTRNMLEQLVRFKRIDGVQSALEAISHNLSGADKDYDKVGQYLADFDGAITLMSSKTDQVVGSPDVDSLPDNVRLVWIDNVGHMPHIEAYDKVVSEIMLSANHASI